MMETLFNSVSLLLMGIVLIWAASYLVEPTLGIFEVTGNTTALALNTTAVPVAYYPDYTVLFALPVIAVFVVIYNANQRKKEEEAYRNANKPVY